MLFKKLQEKREAIGTEQKGYYTERALKALDYLENNYIQYNEIEDKAYYKMSFNDIKKYDFDDICGYAHYDSFCAGRYYETGMATTEGLKPYILAFYNNRHGMEIEDNEVYVEFTDRVNKIKTTEVELAFSLTYNDRDHLLLEDCGVYYNGQIIPDIQINIICQFYNMRHHKIMSENIFYDEDKITFSAIVMSRIATKNGLITKHINKRIVMNTKTGRTYKLNDFDLITKKKTNMKHSPFMSLSSWNMRYNDLLKVNIGIEDFYKIGETIEKSVEGAIPFKEYAKGCFKNNNETYRILIAYNTNPFVSFNVLNNMYLIKQDAKLALNNYDRTFSKKFNCKITRNANVEQEMIKFLTSEGLSKKFINLKINGVTENSFIQDKKSYDQILNMTSLKDKNNKWKLVEAYFKHDYSVSTIENFFNTKIYDALSKMHKENDIVNAVVKIRDSYELGSMARSYDYIKNAMPAYELPKRLRLKEISDTVNSDCKKLKDKSFDYNYDESIKELLNKEIDGYKFTLATTSDELVEVGSRMNICVGSYTENVARRDCMIVYMTKNDKYVGCIEVRPDGKIMQVKAQHNNMFTGEMLSVFKKYVDITELSTDCCYDLTHDDKVRRAPVQFDLKAQLKSTIKIPKVMNGKEIVFDTEDYDEFRAKRGTIWNCNF